MERPRLMRHRLLQPTEEASLSCSLGGKLSTRDEATRATRGNFFTTCRTSTRTGFQTIFSLLESIF